MLAPPRLGHCSNEPELTRAPTTAKGVAGVVPSLPELHFHHQTLRLAPSYA